MPEETQNPGRKWRSPESDEDGDRIFDQYRYTPHTTDLEFFRDPLIYETDVPRTTQEGDVDPSSSQKPRGERLPDERIKDEILSLLTHDREIEATGIRVGVADGVVTLSGHVDSQDEKQLASRIARNAFGVLAIANQLDVDPQAAGDQGG